jgi:transposase InsO family protein
LCAGGREARAHQRARAYQYTALDDCTRLRVLGLSRTLGVRPTLEFLAELRRRFPFPIRKIQTDHGAEFALEFVLAVEEAGIRHRYIRPRRPQQNGKLPAHGDGRGDGAPHPH